jgi:hypothetical protein
VDAAALAHITTSGEMPLIILACYCGSRTLAWLTALYGPEKYSQRARQILRRDDDRDRHGKKR